MRKRSQAVRAEGGEVSGEMGVIELSTAEEAEDFVRILANHQTYVDFVKCVLNTDDKCYYTLKNAKTTKKADKKRT